MAQIIDEIVRQEARPLGRACQGIRPSLTVELLTQTLILEDGMKQLIIGLLMLLAAVTCASGQVIEQTSECADLKAQVTGFESRLKDWPALSRYRDANGRLTPTAKGEKRVVFMGDSITDSWDDPKYGGFFPGKPYIDRGISGQTTPQMLVRFRSDVIVLQPTVVVILAGTNDLAGNTGPTTLEAIEDNLTSMAELAAANHIRVVFASILPISDYESRDGKPIVRTIQRPPEKIRTLNEWIKKYVRDNKLTYVDYYSAMIDTNGFLREEFSEDGLHPNAKGYAVMAPLAEEAISQALRKGK